MRGRIAFDGCAQEKTPLAGREIGARVTGTAIVPKQQIALPPNMRINEFRIFHMIEEDV